MGGRGSNSSVYGSVVIQKRAEPNKQGYAFYVTGKRDVISHWDDEGNYHENAFKTQDPVRMRFNTREEAIRYAKKNGYKYLNL